jgi:hypothetical protein
MPSKHSSTSGQPRSCPKEESSALLSVSRGTEARDQQAFSS